MSPSLPLSHSTGTRHRIKARREVFQLVGISAVDTDPAEGQGMPCPLPHCAHRALSRMPAGIPRGPHTHACIMDQPQRSMQHAHITRGAASDQQLTSFTARFPADHRAELPTIHPRLLAILFFSMGEFYDGAIGRIVGWRRRPTSSWGSGAAPPPCESTSMLMDARRGKPSSFEHSAAPTVAYITAGLSSSLFPASGTTASASDASTLLRSASNGRIGPRPSWMHR